MSTPTHEAIADTLAYYNCRRVNPKADDPIFGYHTFSEDQREFLRGEQAEAAAEIHRMFASTAAQAKAEVLAPILVLHTPEKRWTTPDYTGSFDTREEAAELDESYDGPNVDYFEICAHCGSIERDWAEDHAEEWNYKLAMWPCKTAAAVLP